MVFSSMGDIAWDEAYTVSWALVGSFSRTYVMKDLFSFFISFLGEHVTVMVWLMPS